MKKILKTLLKKQLEIILIALLKEYKIKLLQKIPDKSMLQIVINEVDESELVTTIIENL